MAMLRLTIYPALTRPPYLHAVVGSGLALRTGSVSIIGLNQDQMTTLEMSPEEVVRTPLGSPLNVPFFVTMSELEVLHI